MIPKVSCCMVGFYKSRSFLEMDCPWCGRTHILLVASAIPTPFRTVMPCSGKFVDVVSQSPVVAPSEDDSYGYGS
jgi:hypothetical protein